MISNSKIHRTRTYVLSFGPLRAGAAEFCTLQFIEIMNYFKNSKSNYLSFNMQLNNCRENDIKFKNS